MNTILSKIIIFSLFSILLFSCTTESTNGGVSSINTGDVFVAGIEDNVATVWKNGDAIPLTDGTYNASANSIFVSEDNVYVVGFEGGIAKVWENGVATILEGDVRTVNSIYVSNGVVYVAGSVSVNDAGIDSIATLWIAGVPTPLVDINSFNRKASLNRESVSSEAFSIHGFGDDVYLAGYINGYEADSIPVYWHFNAPFELANEVIGGGAVSVNVSDGIVYVLGYSNGEIVVWEDNGGGSVANTYLSDSDNIVVNSLFVSGGDIYVVGFESGRATIWKNGEATTLSNSDSRATSLFVVGTDVYVVGYELGRATIWKNGMATLLSNSYSSRATSIFVR